VKYHLDRGAFANAQLAMDSCLIVAGLKQTLNATVLRFMVESGQENLSQEYGTKVKVPHIFKGDYVDNEHRPTLWTRTNQF
jgi:hypothetical protein